MIHYITTNGIKNPWVANELKRLDAAGVPNALHALRKEREIFHDADWARAQHERTQSVYPVKPLSFVWSALSAPFRYHTRFISAVCHGLTAPRESLKIRLKMLAHILVAAHWARLHAAEDVRHIHAQWVHSSGSVAMYAAWLLGVSWSFTGHAADLFRERCGLQEKVRRATFISSISSFHDDLYIKLGATKEKLVRTYCGIDVSMFTPPHRDFDWSDRPLKILSTGRLVDKKGFDTLLDTCAILKERSVPFTCTIGGSGPNAEALRAQIDRLELTDQITLPDRLIKQEELPGLMADHDIFALACRWAADNDVDGLPQMLMEAMACGMPAVSTDLVGIPDLVIEDETGKLVPPEDPTALADALQWLRDHPDAAARYSTAGRTRVEEKFNLATCVDDLIARFRVIEDADA